MKMRSYTVRCRGKEKTVNAQEPYTAMWRAFKPSRGYHWEERKVYSTNARVNRVAERIHQIDFNLRGYVFLDHRLVGTYEQQDNG